MELKKNLLKMTVLVVFTLSFHPLRKWFSEMGMCSLSDFFGLNVLLSIFCKAIIRNNCYICVQSVVYCIDETSSETEPGLGCTFV